MEISPPSLSLHRAKLLQELAKGHRAAEFLRTRFLQTPSAGTHDYDSALVDLISNSFDISLAILNNCDPSSLLADCKIEDSSAADAGDSGSRIKDRRGCYKRRKRGESWTKEGEAPTEDGHQWRKYGQKMILNSPFPRNYYRCTHKTEQGCQAVKQVQKTSENPPHYRTNYSGIHTCKNPNKPQQMIASVDTQPDSGFLLSFDTPSTINPFFQISHQHSIGVKQEQLPKLMMPILMNNNNNNNNASSSTSDYNYLSDHGGDVISMGEYSCSASPRSLDPIDNYMMDLAYQFDCDHDI